MMIDKTTRIGISYLNGDGWDVNSLLDYINSMAKAKAEETTSEHRGWFQKEIDVSKEILKLLV